ncbi:methionine adenosyltransferase [Candidatus Nanosalina sp. VS9-1]|uniref:methionine adenosyltransferase n=1 Tax=Candidatus Nanosalina sp. VS9-1 TaxID=3388566 RepID=UPI0039E196DA
MNISWTETEDDPVENREVELVERKGLGHPDSICDGLAEKVSRELSREYRKRFGHILHHNTDEVQLVAGESNPGFGEGEIVEPVFILLTGRATKSFDGEEIPVDKIALDAAKEYIDENFKALDSSHIEFESRIGETSTDLASVYEREERMSNDTSFGVGHAPLSPAEKTVRQVEEEVRGLESCGEDVKVMGLRQGEEITLTVAAAAISSRVSSMDEYREHLESVENTAEKIAEENGLRPEVHVNTADEIEEEEVYLTVTGTSAEMGDDGSVGRGNRVNGLITPHRSMSMEAASGKNPVTHVGKIYNLLAREIAEEIHSETGHYAQVKLLSQIGGPIKDPQLVEVESSAAQEDFEEIVERKLEEIDSVTEKCVEGDISTF